MSRKKPLTRITITLPAPLVAGADRRARELDRSRSWVLAEALRNWLTPVEPGQHRPYPAIEPRVMLIREPSSSPEVAGAGAAEVAEARRQQLLADLRLTPAERLRHAEEVARVVRTLYPRVPRRQIIGFDSYEDFAQWKKRRIAER